MNATSTSDSIKYGQHVLFLELLSIQRSATSLRSAISTWEFMLWMFWGIVSLWQYLPALTTNGYPAPRPVTKQRIFFLWFSPLGCNASENSGLNKFNNFRTHSSHLPCTTRKMRASITCLKLRLSTRNSRLGRSGVQTKFRKLLELSVSDYL